MLSNSTRKLLWFEIAKMMIAVLQNKFIVSFIIIFGTLSFPITKTSTGSVRPFLQGAQSCRKQTERK